MRSALIVSLLMTAVVLAGCSDDGGKKANDEDDLFGDETPTATATTGVIRGVVVDESINPIANATIKILNSELTTTSLETGAFFFSDMEPSSYFLTISKIGFDPIQTNVEVVAGVDKPDIEKVILIRAPGTLPNALSLDFRGYIGCSAQAANVVENNLCGYGPALDPDQSPPFSFGDGRRPDFVQTELVWEHTQEFGRRLTTIQCIESMTHESCGFSGSSPARIGSIHGPSPLICKTNMTDGCGNADGTGGGTGLNSTEWTGQIQLGVFASCYNSCLDLTPVGFGATILGVGVVLQQDYHMYATIFHNFLPDPEWTFYEDGAYVVPSVD